MLAEKNSQNLIQRRVLKLFGRIDAEKKQDLRETLLILDAEDHDEITLLIDSTGGDVIPALDLYDLIRVMRSKVRGIVVGECSSSALVLLQACNSRIAAENSRFLFHSGTATRSFKFSGDSFAEMNRWRMAKLDDEQRLEQIILNRSKLAGETLKELKSLGDEDQMCFGSQKAKELGLIDSIADESVRLF